MEWRRTLRNKRILVGGGMVFIFALLAVFAPLVAPHDPLKMHSDAFFHPMSRRFLLGSDEFGRDILSRLIFGARASMEVALIGVAISAISGVCLGILAAYYGGSVDTVIMRAMDIIMSFPTIVLAIAIVAFLGTNMGILMLTIGFLYMPGVTRVVYSTALTIKYKDYMVAARAVGVGDLRIMRTAILPNIMGPLLVRISLNMGFAILLESGLGFLGLGVQPPTPSWGLAIAAGRGYMEMQPLYVVWPAVFVSLAVLSFNTLGDGLRDVLDPRLRGR